MLRLQQIAKAVHEPLTNVISHLTLKGSGRWFMRFQGQFYGFPSTKKVMVPHELANVYSQVFYKKEIAAHHSLSEELIPKASSSLDSKVVVLLGHFNHGKTSLLDALINHTHKNQAHFATKSDIIPKGNKAKALEKQNFVQMTDGKMSNLVQEEKHGITQVCNNFMAHIHINSVGFPSSSSGNSHQIIILGPKCLSYHHPGHPWAGHFLSHAQCLCRVGWSGNITGCNGWWGKRTIILMLILLVSIVWWNDV